MAYRNAAKQVSAANPAGTLSVSRQILGDLIDLDEKNAAGLKGFANRQKERTTQNLLGEMQAVNTGNPMQDEQIRQTLLKDRGIGLFDMGKINPAMQKFRTEGQEDYLEDVKVKNKLLSESHKKIEREQAFDLNKHMPGTPEYEQALSGITQYNLQNDVTAPGMTAAYKNLADRHNFVLSPETITQGVGVESLGEDGSILVKENFTPDNYEKTVQIAEANIRERFPFLKDQAAIRSKAEAMIKNSRYGPEFARQGAYTAGDREINTLGNNLDASMLTNNSVAINRDVNALLSHFRRNKTSKEVKERYTPQIMQALKSTDINPGSGLGGRFGEARTLFNRIIPTVTRTRAEDGPDWKKGDKYEVSGMDQINNLVRGGEVPVGIQARFKDALRKVYRDKFNQGLPDELLDRQIDNIINGDTNLSTAFARGQRTAQVRTEHEEKKIKGLLDFKGRQIDRLISLRKEEGLTNTINRELLEKWEKKGYLKGDVSGTALIGPNEEYKLGVQVSEVTDKLNNFFLDEDGNDLLSKEARDAYLLTVRRMLVNNVHIDPDTMTRFLGDKPDFILTRKWSDMGGDNIRKLIQLFKRNIPDHRRSVSSKDGNAAFDIKRGAKDLEEALAYKAKQLRDWQAANKGKAQPTMGNPFSEIIMSFMAATK